MRDLTIFYQNAKQYDQFSKKSQKQQKLSNYVKVKNELHKIPKFSRGDNDDHGRNKRKWKPEDTNVQPLGKNNKKRRKYKIQS